ncbi:MAG: hypothetical protein K5694_00970 [Bacilli bacterium]|nr:hypothetical protein [Bacilli bacterium]
MAIIAPAVIGDVADGVEFIDEVHSLKDEFSVFAAGANRNLIASFLEFFDGGRTS